MIEFAGVLGVHDKVKVACFAANNLLLSQKNGNGLTPEGYRELHEACDKLQQAETHLLNVEKSMRSK
ncbi:MAG: hypothetical protein LBT45_02425 [Rickettsiales bacterium]|nr:hypothetical protein [Rickettsiales bacterium]